MRAFIAATLLTAIVILLAIVIGAPWWMGAIIGGIIAGMVIHEDNKFRKGEA